jgi:dihydroorotate dehydrogenase (fumarate)
MPDLSVTYMGLKLDNPIIVGSSGLTQSVEKAKKCEEAGAGAIVIKSLFEETLSTEDWGVETKYHSHTEAYDYHLAHMEMLYGPKEYTKLIEETKKATSIPVIGSINCVSADWWPEFAEQIEAAGADALELNIFTTAVKPFQEPRELEETYLDVYRAVKDKVKIPIALKIGRYLTSIPNFASKLDKEGLDALVLFNRFTEPDIDVDKEEMRTTFSFSGADEMHIPLRWIAVIDGYVSMDTSASTGVKSAEDVVKFLLAGAKTTQVASAFYQHGLGLIEEMKQGLADWMNAKGYKKIDDFRGKLHFKDSKDPAKYLRTQFMQKSGAID